MTSYLSGMPIWASALFIAGFIYSISFIANPAKQAALNAGMTPASARNVQFGIFGFYLLYLAYASILALTGVFATNSIPPKVMVLTSIPLTILLFAIVGNTKLFKRLLRSITLESLISLHVFRVLGVFFILLYFYHLLPRDFALSAGIGDILTALFALPVARMVAKRKPGSLFVAYAWNVFGALDIITLLVIAIINARNAIITGEPGSPEMINFPFMWFPAFAPATILFLHASIFRKLRQVATR
ncbi:MAG: hypothetical protein Q8932_19075 [Bacteroidota bacterium]|nr:hypothetical protein [Bacteroidota bacterium]MDP4255902.1 hypothetical protein [Bacteroidota bacterium]MDP4260279.1 hypothetical protein [Bacteroidota bacterium]